MSTVRIINTKQIKVNITSSLDLSSDESYFSLVTRRRSQNSSMYDYQLQVYDLETMKPKNSTYIYSSYSEQSHPCQITADGTTIAVATKYHIIFYDQKLNLKFKTLHYLMDIYDLNSSPDSRLIAMVGDNTVLIWDSITFKSINFPYPIPTARSCKFSPDNKYLGVSSTSFVTLFQIRPIGDTYQFNLVPNFKAEADQQGVTRGFGTFNTFDFNPTNSMQIVIGFGNASPRTYNFQGGVKQFKRISSEDQPAYSNNFKIVQYMPDGKRVFSSDHLSGIGVWPGDSNKSLAYKQNYILLNPHPYSGGKKVLGYLWESVKVAQIQYQCPAQSKESGKFSLKCQCPDGFFWKMSDQACISCSARNVNICICGSSQYFDSELARCVYNCNNVPNAIKDMRSSNTEIPCFCERGFSWQNGRCSFDCNNIMFSSRPGKIENTCQCQVGFIWDPLSKYCICSPGSQLVRQNQKISCVCLANFKLDQLTRKCVPICPNGSDEKGNCICKQGYQFLIFQSIQQMNKLNTNQQNRKAGKTVLSATNGGCVRNCSGFNNTLGLVSVDKCQCKQNMFWDMSTNICRLDCPKIKNAINSTVVNGSDACTCSKYYNWIPYNIECGRDCSNVQYVNNSKYPTTLSCPCINNFQWNQNSKKCEINCEKIKFAQSYSPQNSYSCICRNIFQWQNSTKNCVVNCTQIWDADQMVQMDTCYCKNNKNFNKTSMTCQATDVQGVFSKPWMWAVLALLVILVVIVGIVMIKFCWKFSSQSENKQHNKKLKKNNQSKKRKRRQKEQQNIVGSQRVNLNKQ